jgi:hypothetical protein
MNDTLTERSTSGFDRAQSHYDNMEPPENTCQVCDGTGRVEVASVLDVDGKEVWWPNGFSPVDIECPFCVGGVRQPDGDYEIQRRDSLADR